MRYEKGDYVYCKVRGSDIIKKSNEKFDAIIKFEIIGIHKELYVINIPVYYNIAERFRINQAQIEEYNLNEKYLNKIGYLLEEIKILKAEMKNTNSDGMFCNKCGLWFGFAEPNQIDCSFRCYVCRTHY